MTFGAHSLIYWRIDGSTPRSARLFPFGPITVFLRTPVEPTNDANVN
jgi:hypothetical protein